MNKILTSAGCTLAPAVERAARLTAFGLAMVTLGWQLHATSGETHLDTTPTPTGAVTCPTEDSCTPVYTDGAWRVRAVTP